MTCICGHSIDDHPEHIHLEENTDDWNYPCRKCDCDDYVRAPEEAGV
jgi:predicted transglutaminase-like cysteine proteinase